MLSKFYRMSRSAFCPGSFQVLISWISTNLNISGFPQHFLLADIPESKQTQNSSTPSHPPHNTAHSTATQQRNPKISPQIDSITASASELSVHSGLVFLSVPIILSDHDAIKILHFNRIYNILICLFGECEPLSVRLRCCQTTQKHSFRACCSLPHRVEAKSWHQLDGGEYRIVGRFCRPFSS
jgi:hypothetical protein